MDCYLSIVKIDAADRWMVQKSPPIHSMGIENDH
jgi:hypothetical protein